jgi:hypothetical protein
MQNEISVEEVLGKPRCAKGVVAKSGWYGWWKGDAYVVYQVRPNEALMLSSLIDRHCYPGDDESQLVIRTEDVEFSPDAAGEYRNEVRKEMLASGWVEPLQAWIDPNRTDDRYGWIETPDTHEIVRVTYYSQQENAWIVTHPRSSYERFVSPNYFKPDASVAVAWLEQRLAAEKASYDYTKRNLLDELAGAKKAAKK